MPAAGARVDLLVPGAQADQGGRYAGGEQQGGALGQGADPVRQHRVEAHALKAFTAYSRGNYPAATAMCLERARIRIRYRQGAPRAHEDLMRAVAACRLIDDLTSAVDHARALLAVWSGLAEQDGGSARDAAWVRGVNRRIRALAIAVAARESGAA